MKAGEHLILLLVGVVCVGLAAALVVVAESNRRTQLRLELRQQAINRGIMGPQGQEIGRNLLRDMAEASVRNPAILKLLEKHGYQVSGAQPAAAGADTNSARVAAPPAAKTEGQTP